MRKIIHMERVGWLVKMILVRPLLYHGGLNSDERQKAACFLFECGNLYVFDMMFA